MILVDTSVWVDHLRSTSAELSGHLEEGAVACHPFVVGELACGNLQNRGLILGLLAALPQTAQARNDEVMGLIDSRALYGRGLGWVDAHLLGSALLAGYPLWTFDKSLAAAAHELGICK
jgi:predicted nucleic acid-binding protein